MIQFERAIPSRAAAVVGDTIADVIGRPLGDLPALVFNVTVQPSGSNIFSGLGTAGSNVSFAELSSATFAQSGYYAIAVTASNGSASKLEIVCWPAAALTVDRVKYPSMADRNAGYPKLPSEQRNVLRALAQSATIAGAQASLEGGAAVAPAYGTKPSTLGCAASDNYTPFGGW